MGVLCWEWADFGNTVGGGAREEMGDVCVASVERAEEGVVSDDGGVNRAMAGDECGVTEEGVVSGRWGEGVVNGG